MAYSFQEIKNFVLLYADLDFRYSGLVSQVVYPLSRYVSLQAAEVSSIKASAANFLSATDNFRKSIPDNLAVLVAEELDDMERQAGEFVGRKIDAKTASYSPTQEEIGIRALARLYANLNGEYSWLESTSSTLKNGSVYTSRAAKTLIALDELLKAVPEYLLFPIEDELGEMFKKVREIVPERLPKGEPGKDLCGRIVSSIESNPGLRGLLAA